MNSKSKYSHNIMLFICKRQLTVVRWSFSQKDACYTVTFTWTFWTIIKTGTKWKAVISLGFGSKLKLNLQWREQNFGWRNRPDLPALDCLKPVWYHSKSITDPSCTQTKQLPSPEQTDSLPVCNPFFYYSNMSNCRLCPETAFFQPVPPLT